MKEAILSVAFTATVILILAALAARPSEAASNVLNKLNPQLQAVIVEVFTKLEAKGWQPIIAEGCRTVAQQREKVRKGYSRTMNSYHVKCKAADIVDKRYYWKVGIGHQFWKDYGKIVTDMRKTNKCIRWGGDWGKGYQRYLDALAGKTRYFVDVAHIEYRC